MYFILGTQPNNIPIIGYNNFTKTVWYNKKINLFVEQALYIYHYLEKINFTSNIKIIYKNNTMRTINTKSS